ncbi:hypothetical protein E4T39_04352 [Aureobasidium subglaciale]|nr:hypothetical protein E4T39_04352 [Aureobasidium subglaciale]
MAPKRPIDDDGTGSGPDPKRQKKGDVEEEEEEDINMDDYADPSPETEEEEDNEDFGMDDEDDEDEESSPQRHFRPVVLEALDYTKGSFPGYLAFPAEITEHVKYGDRNTGSDPGLFSSPTVAGAARNLAASALAKTLKGSRKVSSLARMAMRNIPFYNNRAPNKERTLDEFKYRETLPGGWIGVKQILGKGGQGCTRLFVKVDGQNKIIERIAVKESLARMSRWIEEDMWFPGRYGKDPRESIIHKLLTLETPQKWERYIVKYLSHSINHELKSHRTYMEYVEGGDLDGLFKAHKRPYNHPNPNGGDHIASPGGTAPSESFIWYLLKQMAIALHRMNNIPLNAYKDQYVVHQDIKPANIFLGNPDPNDFPKYPVLKLGDFGSSRITHKFDKNNPSGYDDPQTQGYKCAEMSSHVTDKNDWELSSATNVWQIGMTAATLMKLEWPPYVDYSEIDLEDANVSLDDVMMDYSVELRELVEAMLFVEPAYRPTPDLILEQFYTWQDKWYRMATAPNCHRADNVTEWLHWKPGAQWQVHDFFDNVEYSDPPPGQRVKDSTTATSSALPGADDGGEGGGGSDDEGEDGDDPMDDGEDQDDLLDDGTGGPTEGPSASSGSPFRPPSRDDSSSDSD